MTAPSFATSVTLLLTYYTPRELADRFEVSASTVTRWAWGHVEPAKLLQRQVLSLLDLAARVQLP